MTIKLSNIKFSYPEQPQSLVLDIPNWSVAQGEQLFLHGPSGAGKSTLLNVLSGLLVPTAGTVEVFGNALQKLSNRQRDRFRATHIGCVFQQFNLIPHLNALDNIALAHYFCSNKKTEKATLSATELLNQLGFSVGDGVKPVKNLSVGQQQRVAIARAMVNRPKLLIADEPTSSLDSANTNAFMELLMPMVSAHNITLVFVSHDLSLSRFFSRSDSLLEINQVNKEQLCL